MSTLISRLGFGLALLSVTALAQPPRTVTVPKCQNCTTKASKAMQSCLAAGGGKARAQSCQATYSKQMKHCNKKWCSPKTTKVKVKTPA